MTVKNKDRKIPWKPMIWIVLVVTILTSIIAVVNYNVDKSSKDRAAKRVIENKKEIIKVNDAISKKYDLTCENNIIKKDNYEVIKVNGNYRIIVGDETRELDKTFKIGRCDIIYVIDKEVK